MSLTPKKRSTVQHLINTRLAWDKSITEDSWNLVNEGVTELTESFNPDTDDLQYVAEDNKTHVVKTYAPSIALTAVMTDITDPVNYWMKQVTDKQPIGEEADTGYIRFNLMDEITSKSETNKKFYTAYKRNAVVEVTSIGGAAGDNVNMEVTISGKGEVILGELAIDTTDKNNPKYTFTESTQASIKIIEFTVTNNDSTPISKASVVFDSITKITGDDGKASFSIPSNGTYLYTIAANGYTGQTSNITIEDSSPSKTEMSVKLQNISSANTYSLRD